MAKKARRNSMTAPEEREQDDGVEAGDVIETSGNVAAGNQEIIDFRDRVVDFTHLSSTEILDHPNNPRRHNNQQRAAMRGVLNEIGIADAVLVYRSERAGGHYVAIDGHMRKNDFEGTWPCLVLDLDDAEADKYIQVHDPVSQMADTDIEILNRLREQGEFDDASVRVMLDGINTWTPGKKGGARDGGERDIPTADPNEQPIPEMELQPYEHYDYMLVLATTTFDWNFLVCRLGLAKVDGSTDPRYKKIGLGRAVTADKLIRVFRERDDALQRVRELEKKLANA